LQLSSVAIVKMPSTLYPEYNEEEEAAMNEASPFEWMMAKPKAGPGNKVDVVDYMPGLDIPVTTSVNRSQALTLIADQAAKMEQGAAAYVAMREQERNIPRGLPPRRGPNWRSSTRNIGKTEMATRRATFSLQKMELLAEEALVEIEEVKEQIAKRVEEERLAAERAALEKELEEEAARQKEEEERQALKEEAAKANEKEEKKGKKDKKKKEEEIVVEPPGTGPLPIALLFTGQGVQFVGMGSTVVGIPAAQDLVQRAKDTLGYDVLDLCLNGPIERLNSMECLLPALLTCDLCSLEKLKLERPWTVSRASAVAGLSCGEYAALVAAGVMTFEDGLKVMRARGQLLQHQIQNSGINQRMCSIVGIKREKLESICAHVQKENGGVASIACYLFENGYTVSGGQKEVESVEVMARKWGVQRSVILPDIVAYHCDIQKPVADGLQKILEECLPRMSPPTMTVWCNSTATGIPPGTDPKEFIPILLKQCSQSVLWEEEMRNMLADGINELYELGPGKQLKTMLKRIDQDAFKATKAMDC